MQKTINEKIYAGLGLGLGLGSVCILKWIIWYYRNKKWLDFGLKGAARITSHYGDIFWCVISLSPILKYSSSLADDLEGILFSLKTISFF